MRTLLQTGGLLLLLCTAATQSTSQTELVGQLQARTEQALVDGDLAQTTILAQQLTAQNPNGFAGHFLLALAQLELSENRQAARSAGRAYRNATTEEDKLQAARLAGSARYRGNQFTRSELWLRRAINHADTVQDAQAVVDEFQRARQANPLTMQFGGWAAPSDNINNGAKNDTFQLEGIDLDFNLPANRLALSGVEYAVSAQGNYRLWQDGDKITTLGGQLFGRTYSLSSSAQQSVPGLSGSDYALILTEVSLTHQRQLLNGLGPTSFTGRLGRVWYSGDPLWNYKSASVGQIIPINAQSALNISGGAKTETSLNPAQADTKIYDLGGTYSTQLANNDLLQVSLLAVHSDGGFENIFTEYRSILNYAFAEPILNTNLSVRFELGHRSYDEFETSLDGRRDVFGTVGATAVFNEVSYFGFSPSISVSATRTKSDVEEFTSSQIEAQLGIQSNF